jgi:hypothetical protein
LPSATIDESKKYEFCPQINNENLANTEFAGSIYSAQSFLPPIQKD